MKKYFAFLIIIFAFSSHGFAKQHILFIVNPISQGIRDINIEQAIKSNLDGRRFTYEIAYTQKAGHATEIAHEAISKSVDIVAAVGGDGTVNEVGKALINSDVAMAIIPIGSGNGLARHLQLPLEVDEAIRAINRANVGVIDTAEVNGKPFLGVAGIGFDAHVAEAFAHFEKRGFSSYCQVAFQEYGMYKSQIYVIDIDGKRFKKKAFILSFANSSQYGNNFTIAPMAKLGDGYLDLVIIDEMPFYRLPEMVFKFLTGQFENSNHYESFKFKELVVEKESDIQAHIDGEPMKFGRAIRVKIVPRSLKIMFAG